MRAIILAAVVLSALALSATPTQAADRTVQTEVGDAESAPVSEWFGRWLEFVLHGTGDPVVLTLALLPAEEEIPPKDVVDEIEESGRNRVILEDGAPF